MQNINLEDYKGVFVFAQQVDNELSPIAFELLGEAGRLAKPLNTEVTAVLLGSKVGNLVDKLAEYGADKVIVVDDPELETYRTEPYAHALASVIEEYKPEIMLVGATAIGRDLGPTVSARVATGLTADCTLLEIGDFPINPIPGKEQKHNQLLMTRPAFGGNTIATIACPDNRPQMATVRAGVMQKADPKPGAKAEVIEFNPGFEKNNKYGTTAIQEAKDYLDKEGIEYVERTGTTTDEVQLAADALIADGVDAVFTPTDNTIMTAELSIYEKFIDAGIPHYTGADSFALNGAFVGYGVDYANLGQKTADMIADILIDNADPSKTAVETFDNGTATVNTETCKALGLDFDTVKKAFEPLCTQVNEITTAESFDEVESK